MPSRYTPFLAQAGANIGNAMASRGQRERLEAQNKLAGDAYLGDPQALKDLMSLNPQLGAKIMEESRKRKASNEQQALQKRTQFKTEYNDIMGNIAKFDSFEESQSYGDDRIKDIAERYPEIMAQVGENNVFDQEDFDLAKQIADTSKTGLYSAKTEIFKDGTVVQAKPGGGVEVKDPSGKTVEGQERLDVLAEAQKAGVDFAASKVGEGERKKLEAQKEIKPEIVRETKQVEAAVKTSVKAFEQVDKIQKNIFNLRDAIDAVKAGAGTGPLESKLPSIRSASVTLDNIQGRLGLDVVGAVTFGALSKGELDLAKAVALPTGLDGPELVKWIEKKISAQEKLMNYFAEQAVFLSQGNSQADWLKFKKEQQKELTPDEQTELEELRNLIK